MIFYIFQNKKNGKYLCKRNSPSKDKYYESDNEIDRIIIYRFKNNAVIAQKRNPYHWQWYGIDILNYEIIPACILSRDTMKKSKDILLI